MKIQIIRKGEKYAVRQRFLCFWLYFNPNWKTGWKLGQWSAGWLNYRSAKAVYKKTIDSYQKHKEFSDSQVVIIEKNDGEKI